MQTFVVMSTQAADAPALERAVRGAYAGAHQDVTSNIWLIADRGVTADEVCQKLGVKRTTPSEPGIDGVVVLSFDDFYGHASNDIWHWIAEKRKVE